MPLSQSTLAMPSEILHIGVRPAEDMGKGIRHWLPSFLVSFCVNLFLLYLFSVVLQSETVNSEFLPITVTLSQAPQPTAKIEKPIEPPPKPQAPRPQPQPKPRTLPPEPAPQPPEPMPEPEPQPTVIAAPEPPPPPPEPVTKPEPPPPPKAVPLFKLSRLPAFTEQTTPAYPETERAGGREADVLAEVFIDATGRVLDVTIVTSGGDAFDQAVVAALNESHFTPGYMEAEAVAVRFRIPFHFQLD